MSQSGSASTSGRESGPATDPDRLGRGIRLLERSVSMICHAMMGEAVAACPEDWSPFAMLAWMFAQVKLQHTETTQRIMAGEAGPAAVATESSVGSGSAGDHRFPATLPFLGRRRIIGMAAPTPGTAFAVLGHFPTTERDCRSSLCEACCSIILCARCSQLCVVHDSCGLHWEPGHCLWLGIRWHSRFSP